MMVFAAAFLLILQLPRTSSAQSKIVGPFNVRGTVRDANGKPVEGATVSVTKDSSETKATGHAMADGRYFIVLPEGGAYFVSASAKGFGDAKAQTIEVKRGVIPTVDLTLQPADSAGAQSPEFFDEPEFTVAGITESMSPGGHGSDVILRTTEALAKETVTLKKTAEPNSSSTSTQTEAALRKKVEAAPESFDANRQMGQWLAENGKPQEGIPFLERAAKLKPDDTGNSRDLATAYAAAGDFPSARREAKNLLTRSDSADLHHLLADIEEKSGNSLDAVHEYERAAEMDPTEQFVFDWGAELLLHRAVDPAIEVFKKGAERYPQSARMLVGLGVARYARGYLNEAAQNLCEASDLSPDDATPYLFLGRMQSAQNLSLEGVAERLGRFSRLRPQDAQAQYYYAIGLLKQRKRAGDSHLLAQARLLLVKSVELDPKFGPAYLQLGILSAEREDIDAAIGEYQKAIEANPKLEEAHYRLALAYQRAGDTANAQKELEIYNQVSKQSASEAERERQEVQQFVYKMRNRPAQPQQP